RRRDDPILSRCSLDTLPSRRHFIPVEPGVTNIEGADAGAATFEWNDVEEAFDAAHLAACIFQREMTCGAQPLSLQQGRCVQCLQFLRRWSEKRQAQNPQSASDAASFADEIQLPLFPEAITQKQKVIERKFQVVKQGPIALAAVSQNE